jgi:hypothetical protein
VDSKGSVIFCLSAGMIVNKGLRRSGRVVKVNRSRRSDVAVLCELVQLFVDGLLKRNVLEVSVVFYTGVTFLCEFLLNRLVECKIVVRYLRILPRLAHNGCKLRAVRRI